MIETPTSAPTGVPILGFVLDAGHKRYRRES